MKELLVFKLILLMTSLAAQGQAISITGVMDGPLSGGLPKAIEIFVAEDIPDLSICGVGSAQNGEGSGGEEFTFPNQAVLAGTYLYVATETTGFQDFFGFVPDFTSNVANINGNDAIELFCHGTVHDVFGDINTDGSGEPWEYMDGWAYRHSNTGPDGSTFVLGNWFFSSPNALDGATTNASAVIPFPLGTFNGALPVELVAFDAVLDGRAVRLVWETASETNNAGFEIQRRIANGEWEVGGFVEGHGTTEQPQQYAYRIAGLLPGVHRFRLKQIDYDGTFAYSPEVEVAVAVPEAYRLSSVYPNPVRTQIQFSLSVARAQYVEVGVYDLLGRRVVQPYAGPMVAGTTQAFMVDAAGWPGGVYVLRVTGTYFTASQQVVRIP